MIWPAAAIRRRVIVRGFLAAGAVSPETAGKPALWRAWA